MIKVAVVEMAMVVVVVVLVMCRWRGKVMEGEVLVVAETI